MHLSSYLGLTIWGSDGLSFSFIGTHFLLNSARYLLVTLLSSDNDYSLIIDILTLFIY